MIIYRGSYTDIETNPLTNENAQVVKRLDLIDMSSNPFNVVLTEEVSGTDTIYTFSFDTLPVTAIGTAIEYTSNGGLNWFLVPGGTTSPQSITLPTLDYEFSFTIQIPGGWLYWSNINQIVPLEFTDNPVNDVVIDNDENVFTPIRSRQLEIEIFSSNSINIRNFVDGGDDRFKVDWYIDDVLNFTGHLSVADISQEFLPDPNVISLTAVDGLGLLSDIPLTDRNGEVPTNEIEILDLLQFALSKTSLQLNLKVIFNIREETASNLDDDITGAGHFFRYCFLDAKTFEDEIGTCENCYDVISKILGHEAVLFQHLGEWVILRIDEVDYDLPLNTYYKWNWVGDFIEKGTESNQKNIGVGEDYSFMNDSAVVYIAQLFRQSILNYKYETPKEIPCNPDFERGDLIDGSDPDSKTYELDCWGQYRENYPTSGLITATVTIYVRRLFLNGYETERYVVIPWAAVSSNLILSSNIPVVANEKIEVTMSRRLSADVSGSGFYRDNGIQVRLIGDDGTYWTLQGETSVGDPLLWVASNSDFTTNNNYLWFEGDTSRDMTEPESLYGETISPPMPVGGIVQVLAHQSHINGWNRDTYILQVGVKMIPFINGSYELFTGQQTIVSQSVGNRNTREEDVFISDSPSPIYKGAIKIFTGVGYGYPLAGLFYDAARNPAGTTEFKKYAEIQAYDVWNQVNRTMVRFEADIDHSNPAPALINKYYITDANVNSNNRIFLLLHYDYNSYLCEWNAFLTEVVNSNEPKEYTGLTFKYITK